MKYLHYHYIFFGYLTHLFPTLQSNVFSRYRNWGKMASKIRPHPINTSLSANCFPHGKLRATVEGKASYVNHCINACFD